MELKRMLMLLLVLLLCGCAGREGEPVPEFVLTYAENQPAGYPTVLGAQRFADLVRERTGGKVVIQVKCGGEFGTEQEVLEQMAFAGVDFARVSLAELSDEIPKLNVLQLPFLYEDADHMWRILDGDIGRSFLTIFEEVNLVGLSWYDAGARCFYSDCVPIHSPADLKGLTVRVQDSSMVMDMVTLLGAEPVILDYSDVYYAFEMGKIEAAENNWASYQVRDHWQVARYFTKDEHTRVPEIQLVCEQTWEKLPEEYRQIMRECAWESAQYQRELWLVREEKARAEVLASGCREIVLTHEEKEAFRTILQPLYEQYCAEYMDLVEEIRNG